MIGSDTDETNFPCVLLLTDRQALRLLKAFLSNSSTEINVSKTQLSEMMRLTNALLDKNLVLKALG